MPRNRLYYDEAEDAARDEARQEADALADKLGDDDDCHECTCAYCLEGERSGLMDCVDAT